MLLLVTSIMAQAQSLRNQSKENAPLQWEKGGGVTFIPDGRGNSILDYSYCGYRMSERPIPEAAVMVTVSCGSGDQYARLQRAIDYVSSLKADKVTGLRGAVLLSEGTYEVSQPLRISASGVVLRGASKKNTIIRKMGVDRGAVIYLEGNDHSDGADAARAVDISSKYVPVGSKTLTVSDVSPFKVGASVVVLRPSTKEWIQSVGCDVFGGNLPYWGWKPGEMDVRWERKVVAIEGNTLTLDAPLTVALDEQWGGGKVMPASSNRISDSGVENLTVEAQRNSDYDEDHAWDGIYVDAAENCWVRIVDFRNLAGSAVIVHRYAQQITVEDCTSRQPQSEVGGLRRRTFLTMGGKCLFQRCYSEHGINDFSAGYCAPGPNAFVQCDAYESFGFSGGSSSWATGLLFDIVNVDGGKISFRNLGLEKWGAGWNTANSMLWQCTASVLECYDVSDDARCYAVGCWSYCDGDGYWTATNDHVHPYSLYSYQLQNRLGDNAKESVEQQCRVLTRNLDASSSPSVEKAAEMARIALEPRVTQEMWIEKAFLPVSALTLAKGCKDVDKLPVTAAAASKPASGAQPLAKGLLDLGDGYIAGGKYNTPWWNGRTRYPYMDKAAFAVTRFIPGMEQRGGTDRMDSVLAILDEQDVRVWNQNYGLWYDRRRDDHERTRRIDGDVWAPFWEQAFKRSGEGKAWDGLSKYDLTKLSPWYIHRVKQLAEGRPQMVLINQHYFQHNILEAGAHWVDCPWRSTNNINNTGFLEPVPFTGDKRIFTADAFYDVTNQHRAQLHRQYIEQMLDAFADDANVYHSVSEEFTGTQAFTEFWLDCIIAWRQRTGKRANIVLNATRDVVLAIMQQPRYAEAVDAVEIEQWFYDAGELYAPEGGKNLAPRQHGRLKRTGHPTADDVYRTVGEIVSRYPGTPVLYYAKEYDRNPWAVLFAGGSCPTLHITDANLLSVLGTLRPVFDGTVPAKKDLWVMKNDNGNAYLIYNNSDADQSFSLPATMGKGLKTYGVDRKNGTLTVKKTVVNGNSLTIAKGETLLIK